MAVLINCWKCNKEFITSANGSPYCDDCNGVNEHKKKEQERWDSLTHEQKTEELFRRVVALENHDCNPCIG